MTIETALQQRNEAASKKRIDDAERKALKEMRPLLEERIPTISGKAFFIGALVWGGIAAKIAYYTTHNEKTAAVAGGVTFLASFLGPMWSLSDKERHEIYQNIRPYLEKQGLRNKEIQQIELKYSDEEFG